MSKLRFLIVFVVLLFLAVDVEAAVLSWVAPSSRVDNTAITTTEKATITYPVYYGPSATGPWTLVLTTAAGITNATVPVGAAGVIRYYTVEAVLGGLTSAKAPPVSYTTPFAAPAVPSGLTITE